MRKVSILVLAAAVAALVGGVASAHECDDPNDPSTCQPTQVYDNWRPQYVPLFGLADREDPEQRREAQRWRDEWGCDTQFCVWIKFQLSANDDDNMDPQSVHAGSAGDHSLAEAAHDSEGHQKNAEDNHDAHGGAAFVDVCVGTDEGTSYEGQAGACSGPQDTQVGVVIMDHNPCGTVVPVVACTDEYHVVRPLDPAYTAGQIGETQEEVAALTTPEGRKDYVCGFEEHQLGPCRGLVP